MAETEHERPAPEGPAERAGILYEHACKARGAGDLDRALELLAQAVEEDPTEAGLHAVAFHRCDEGGRAEEPEQALRRGIEYAEDWTPFAVLLACRCHDTGRLEESEALCRRAIDAEPTRPEAYSICGTTLLAAGRGDEAETVLRRGIEIDASYAELHLNLAATLRSLGRLEDALASAREAVRLDPDSLPCRSGLQTLLEEAGEGAG